jgi:hypothetical protein
MKQYPKALRRIAVMVAVAFTFMAVVVAPVHATMVGTDVVLQAADVNAARQTVKSFLDRQEVIERLQAWGVEPAEAQARIDAMTAEEVTLLAGEIDQLPAGGDAFGLIIGVALIAFIVLLVLDIMGVTDIFTFIKKK